MDDKQVETAGLVPLFVPSKKPHGVRAAPDRRGLPVVAPSGAGSDDGPIAAKV
jgi:hypothetical protein